MAGVDFGVRQIIPIGTYCIGKALRHRWRIMEGKWWSSALLFSDRTLVLLA